MKRGKQYFCFAVAVLVFALAGCQTTLSGSIQSSTGVASASVPPAPEAKEIPDLQLALLTGNFEHDASGKVTIFTHVENGERMAIQIPFDDQAKNWESFMSKEVMAVINIGQENNRAYGKISNDGGENWRDFTVPPLEGHIFMGVEIGFTSVQEGWVLYHGIVPSEKNFSEPSRKHALYKTKDGGASWEFYTFVEFGHGLHSFSFASPMVGWVALNSWTNIEGTYEEVYLYETWDGGKTWERAAVALQPEMQEEMTGIQTRQVEWEDGRWVLPLWVYKNIGHSQYPLPYDLRWDATTAGWVWDNPGWTLPEGVSTLHFMEYVVLSAAAAKLFCGKWPESSRGLFCAGR